MPASPSPHQVSSPVTDSPILLYVTALLALACAAALAAAIGGGIDPSGWLRVLRRAFRPVLERERSLIIGLGWSPRLWVLVRVGAMVGGTLLAIPSQIPLLIFGAPIAALLAVPWLMSGRAANRRLRQERAMADWVRTVVARMRRNQGIDVILRDSGAHPPLQLEPVLSPLADTDMLVDEALVEMAARASFPEAEMLCLTLLASRTRRQEDLIGLLEGVLLPVMEAKVTEQADALEAVTQRRAQAVAMSLIMLAMTAALLRVDVIRAGYSTAGGQVVLGVVGLTFVAVLFIVSRLYVPPPVIHWDLEAYRRELRGLGSV